MMKQKWLFVWLRLYLRRKRKMKYKPCCDRRCLLGTCKIRDNGGCYCLCRYFDHLNTLESGLNGNIIFYGEGNVYYPDVETTSKILNKMDNKSKEKHLKKMKNIYLEIENTKNLIKKYENS